jgi:hypothetical protein
LSSVRPGLLSLVDISRLSGYGYTHLEPGTKEIPSVTLTIAPPDLQPTTASSAVVLSPDDEQAMIEALVEEPMDYTPIARGHLSAPDYPDEVEPEDDGASGPMGF